jgi:hypothetical protein
MVHTVFFEIVQDNTQLSKILTNKNELKPDIEKKQNIYKYK